MLDMWKSSAGHHYIGIVILWLDHNFKMRSAVLRVLKMDTAHTSANISADVHETLDDFFLVPSLFVGDNASNQVHPTPIRLCPTLTLVILFLFLPYFRFSAILS